MMLDNARLILLPRGGTYVQTAHGPIQLGLPPETIKDAMAMKLDVPSVFVVPGQLFDRLRGISFAEFEFPAYYNFFKLGRRTRLVVDDASVEARVRAIFQETLFGPAMPPNPGEFAESYPLGARPDFARESEYFRNVPGRRRIATDDLLEFVHLGSRDVEVLPGLHLRKTAERYELREADQPVLHLPLTVELPPRVSRVSTPQEVFRAPAFGVTVLGASHGFDPSGKTTGFLLWIGGRALIIDPPIDTSDYLRERGVPSKLIDGVILTHCHADHDAGTFQSLLEETQLRLYTTPHILGSFLRKYSALSGLSSDVLRRTFAFHPVRIGAPTYLRGGELWFRYNLHSIPSLGVSAFYGGKSIAISGDTLFAPARVNEMFEAGVMGAARRDELNTFPSHHNVVLHEAGIAPLHTPVAELLALPDEAKRRLSLVHIASKDVPAGLVAAKVGLQHTIALEVGAPRHADAIELLDALSMVDFLRDLPLGRAKELLQVATAMQFAAGYTIVHEGARGDAFYVLTRGLVVVEHGGEVLKTYSAGDYFGESALILDRPRSASVRAKTEVEVLCIARDEFLQLLRGSEIVSRLLRLARGQAEGTWELLGKNSVLARMSSAQKTQLETFLTPLEVQAGDVLWSAGDEVDAAYLLASCTVAFDDLRDSLFGPGAFVGEIDGLLAGAPARSTARVVQGGRLCRIDARELTHFFDENPGALLAFLGARATE